ncbi:hypothetical protein [Aurantimonas sp. VKM B-3413]|uniref:hypothetical protein n=1 Tax=Aurantimonas sp. VKM B-3413 TaxID=2779401 RepID=UPI001E378E29|nr:hypothetical protein [Aurantimonas sp. VKM B-3413]MCB8838424.1 hypothetical protein [Aurantimonas sp. VKM B-3413]
MKTLDDRALDDAMNPDPRKTGGMASEADAPKKRPATEAERPADEDDEELDEALDETFPASDPVSPSRIDGPTDSER